MFFIEKIKKIVNFEKELESNPRSEIHLRAAKQMGFSDSYVAELWKTTEEEIYRLRQSLNLYPVYKMIDSCSSEFDSYIPYFYSTYAEENESISTNKKKIIVLGSGPIRIGQGVEFDYSTVHAIHAIREMGYEAIVINNNPETVSTDYSVADKLYFEPLTTEDVMNVIHHENPLGVIATLGGQTAVNLVAPLSARGVKIIGADSDAINRAEDRDAFDALIKRLHIPNPKGQAVTKIEEGVEVAKKIGYPVLVRPSFVLGGRAMEIVADEIALRKYLKNAVEVDDDKPVLIDKYITGKEIEVDAIYDGKEVFIPGVMELVERAGVHSGDSTSVYPPFSISEIVKETIADYVRRLGAAVGVVGLFNIQFIVDKKDRVYIIEVNPRASRSVPFLSKSTGYNLVRIATKAMLGQSLKEQGIASLRPNLKVRWHVKAPAFSFAKLSGMDAYLSPEMKSTGEAIGYDMRLNRAFYKALQASGVKMKDYGSVIATIADEDKEEAFPLIERFYKLGFNILATSGTAAFLKRRGIRTRILPKISEGNDEILRLIRTGYVSYIINTRSILSGDQDDDGVAIRSCAVQNGVTVFTSLDTARIVLDVLEEIIPNISTI
jgi:carbamoyl-phosphate synthase large subunit